MKKFKILPIAFLLLTLGLTGCGGGSGGTNNGGGNNNGGGGNNNQQQEEEHTSPIKSLTANVENLELKLGESVSASSYYKLTGYKTLSSKEKKVTITAADPEVVKIVGNIMTGLKVNGSTTITIKSNADETKTCSFSVLVKDIFFNRTYSEINASDNMEKELPDDGGIIQSTGGTSDTFVFNQKASTSFMASVKLAVNSVTDGELWPKFGMAFKQVNEDEDLTSDFVLVFLDGPMNKIKDGSTHWTDFGYCEIANGVYGWDSNPSLNRHKENVFIKNTAIEYDEFFTLTSVVEGRKIHMFLGYGEGENAKEVYMFTLEAYAELYGEGEGRGFIPGLFQFNSVVTYKDYTYSTDATAIAAQMDGVTERLASYDHSAGDIYGESYHE